MQLGDDRTVRNTSLASAISIRDRGSLITGGLLVAFALLAWLGVVRQTVNMSAGMPGDAADYTSILGMTWFLAGWGVMMAAMMLPSATPMMLVYRQLSLRNSEPGARTIRLVTFVGVYLVIWLGFGVFVYLAGWLLRVAIDADPAIADRVPYALAVVLVVAGLYQFSPLKRACLRSCRSPLSFLMGRWRPGRLASAQLATAHALYCVGCCAALMVVLVAAGAMSLSWVLLIAAIVFIEKLLPQGDVSSRVVGAGLIVLGLAVAANPDLAAMLRGVSLM